MEERISGNEDEIKEMNTIVKDKVKSKNLHWQNPGNKTKYTNIVIGEEEASKLQSTENNLKKV